MKRSDSARKKNSPPRFLLPSRLFAARKALKQGQYDADLLNDPKVVAQLDESEQLALWRAHRSAWLGDDGRSSVDDLYREHRLSKEFHGFRIAPSNSLKRLKGPPPKKAAIEAKALGGEVRWLAEFGCPGITLQVSSCVF